MSSEVKKHTGTDDLPYAIGAKLPSIALVSPDMRKRQIFATALAEPQLADFREFHTYPRGDGDLQWLLRQSYDIIVLDLDTDQEVALNLVERITANGTATVMVFSEQADQKLAVRSMRSGAREFLLLPLEDGVIAEALARNATATRPKAPLAERRLGSLSIFLGAKGGSGITTAACNFAVALSRLSEQKTLLIDLNLPIGDAALTLGLFEGFSTEDAFRNIERLDASLLQEMLTKHKSGLMVLAAPSKFTEVKPSRDAIGRLIDVARSAFDHVVVDMGSRFDAAGAGIFGEASTIYLVTHTGVADLRNSHRLISQYFRQDSPKMEVVLNRFEGRTLGSVGEDFVSKSLGVPVRWKIPEDQGAAREMQHGETGDSETGVSRVCLEMAGSITGRDVPQKKKKGFGRKSPGTKIAEPGPSINPLSITRTASDSGSEFARYGDVTFKPSPIVPAINEVTGAPTAAHRLLDLEGVPAENLPSAMHADSDSIAGLLNTPEVIDTPSPGVSDVNETPGEPVVLHQSLDPAGDSAGISVNIAHEAIDSGSELAGAPEVISMPSPDVTAAIEIPSQALDVSRDSAEDSPAIAQVAIDSGPKSAHILTVTFAPEPAVPVVSETVNAPPLAPRLVAEAPVTAVSHPSIKIDREPPLVSRGTPDGPWQFNDAGNNNAPRSTRESKISFRRAPNLQWLAPAAIQYGEPLSETQLNASASAPGTFEYKPGLGELLAPGVHTLSVVFFPANDENYSVAQASVQLEVAVAPATIVWPNPDPIQYGTPLSAKQLCAVASVPGTYVYSPAAGEMLPAGRHELSVTFTPTEVEHYAGIRASVPIDVARTAPSITWPAPQAIREGTPLTTTQLNATASVAGTFSYRPSHGEELLPGTHKLTVNFTPTDGENHLPTSATVTLAVVAKAAPVIAWPKPDPITYGTPLSATQLCATASVAGKLEYSPAIGELLSAGNHTLSVTFTPDDSENYAGTQATVLLAVARMTPTIIWANPEPIVYGSLLGPTQLCAAASVPGSFAYSPAAGEALAAGRHQLRVRFNPNDNLNYATADATISIEVKKATPVIDWPAPSPIQCGTALGAMQLQARASVPGTFTYSPAPGDVLAAGSHTLSATFLPDDSVNCEAAHATASLQVVKITPSIAWPSPKSITYGALLSAEHLCADTSAPGTLIYSHKPGMMLPAGAHALSVKFVPSDVVNYSAAEATVLLEVIKATPAIAWPSPDPIQAGTALSASQLCATASVPGTFHYSPAPGEVLAAGKHTLSVTFIPTDEANYTATPATVPLAVFQVTPSIVWANPDKIVYGTLLSSAQLCATASVPGTFEYSPAAGEALAAGKHVLRASFTPLDSVNYTATVAAALIEVAKATPVVDWPAPDIIQSGTALGDAQLRARASVPGTLTYTPAQGEVLAAGSHTLSVLFSPEDSANFETAHATTTLNVVKTTPSIAWPNPEPITYGTSLSIAQLNATASVPGRISYSHKLGTMLPVGRHVLSLKLEPSDSANYLTAEAAVSLEVIKATPAIAWPSPDPIQAGTALSASHLCATASVPGTFDYSPAAGEVLSAGMHTLTVTFTPSDSENYHPATASIPLTITKRSVEIEWASPDPIAFGRRLGPAQLCAKASVPGRFDYSPGIGETLTAGKHELSATFTPTDIANYNITESKVLLTVFKAAPIVDWPIPEPITCNSLLSATQLCAVASVPGSFRYAPEQGTALAAGNHTLSVIFTPEDNTNYTTIQATISLEVVKATPSIDWPTPHPITCGTKLSASQLNADSWVPGAFVYSPEVGDVLPVGKQTLSVTFIPADSASYATVHTTVTIDVNEKRKPAITWPQPSLVPYGTPLGSDQLRAIASIPGTFTYIPEAGTVLPVGMHQLRATFTPTDTAENDNAEATVMLNVIKAQPTITWLNPDSIAYGTPISHKQLCATASIPGTFEYYPGAGKVLRVGDHQLSVTFTPEDSERYAVTSATTMLTVTKATPILEWPKPKPIRQGRELTSAQLCCEASVPGELFYSPAPGDELPEGWHDLTVTFTPLETEFYEAGHATVALEVRKRFPWGGIVAAVSACLLLLLLVFLIPIFKGGSGSTPARTVQPPPSAVEAQSAASTSKPAHKPKPAQSKASKEATASQPSAATPAP